MKRDFKSSKYITKYLDDRYGKINRNTIDDDIQYVKDIVADHSIEDLQMMSKRINASISYKKDTGYLDNHVYILMSLLVSILSTLSIAIMNLGFNFGIAYINNFLSIHKEEIKKNDNFNLNGIFNFNDIGEVLRPFIITSFIGFFIVLIGVSINIKFAKGLISKLYSYSILIEEAIELKKNEGKSKEKINTKRKKSKRQLK